MENNTAIENVNTKKNKIKNFKYSKEIKTINPSITKKKINITNIKIEKERLNYDISTLLKELYSHLHTLEENTYKYKISKSLIKEVLTLKKIFNDIEKCKKHDDYFYEDKKYIFNCLNKELKILKKSFSDIKEIESIYYYYLNYDIESSFIFNSYKKALTIT